MPVVQTVSAELWPLVWVHERPMIASICGKIKSELCCPAHIIYQLSVTGPERETWSTPASIAVQKSIASSRMRVFGNYQDRQWRHSAFPRKWFKTLASISSDVANRVQLPMPRRWERHPSWRATCWLFLQTIRILPKKYVFRSKASLAPVEPSNFSSNWEHKWMRSLGDFMKASSTVNLWS